MVSFIILLRFCKKNIKNTLFTSSPSMDKLFDYHDHVNIRKVWEFHENINKGLADEGLDEKIVYERKSNEFLCKN